jgi:hypothetical protein
MQALSVESTAITVEVCCSHLRLGLKQLSTCSSTELKAIIAVL